MQQFAEHLEEMEAKFQRKAEEITKVQIELKMIKEFRKQKARMEKELEEVSLLQANILLMIWNDVCTLYCH